MLLCVLCAVAVVFAASTCDNSSFPVALHEVQCYGLQHEPSASASPAACQDACCARGAARCSRRVAEKEAPRRLERDSSCQ